jgi:CubicO group peptidase (beta-lactamase class C family)
LTVFDKARGGLYSQAPAFEAGGGGLVSTADDFLAFARMLLNKGQVGKERILSPATIAQMTTDQITPAQKTASPFFPGFWDTNGWGFGLSVNTAPDKISATPGRFGWDGGYGTTFIADPAVDLVAILLAQRVMQSPDDAALNIAFMTETYRALA